MRRTGLPTTWAAHGSCPDSGLWEYGIWISGPVSAYQYPAWKVASGKVPHVEASPELRCCKFRILDLRIVPPPPADRGAPKDLRSFYRIIAALESLEGNQRPCPRSVERKLRHKAERQVRPEPRTLRSVFSRASAPYFLHPPAPRKSSDFRTLPSLGRHRIRVSWLLALPFDYAPL